MRAVGYIRVSTDEQAEHGVGVEAQRDRIAAYARLYDLELVNVLVDEGVSGSAAERPGLRMATNALEDGHAEALVVAKLDRLTRSLPHLLSLIDEYFGERFTLLSVAEQLDPRTASGRLVMNILGAVAQWERETISERTKAALAFKRSQGEYTGGGVPFGFRLDHAGRLRRNMWEARAIDEARAHAGRGLSLRQIGRALEADGFFPRASGRWRAKQVSRLLREDNHETRRLG